MERNNPILEMMQQTYMAAFLSRFDEAYRESLTLLSLQFLNFPAEIDDFDALLILFGLHFFLFLFRSGCFGVHDPDLILWESLQCFVKEDVCDLKQEAGYHL